MKASKIVVQQVERLHLTTGILNRNRNTNFAHIEVANYSTTSESVVVAVYSWDGLNPVLIPGGVFNVTLPANSRRTFNVNVSSFIHYAVRLNIPEDRNVVVNIFGVTGGFSDPNFLANQEGNTVLFEDLVEI